LNEDIFQEELELPKDNLVKGKVRFSKPNLLPPEQLCERTGTPFRENILTYKRVYPFCFHNEDEIFVSKKSQKIDITTKNDKDENMENKLTSRSNQSVDDNQVSCSTSKRPFSLLSGMWYEMVGKMAEHDIKENRKLSFQETAAPDHQRPFPLIKKEWYQRRGQLATKKTLSGKRKTYTGCIHSKKTKKLACITLFVLEI
jgi:hypothetical protein